MVEIIQDFIPVGRINRPGIAMIPLYITVHNTDNTAWGAGALNHASYIKTVEQKVSWHYTVDDKRIIQHLPLNETGFHAGDGSGPGNRKSIGIEICENPDCNKIQAEKNAVDLMIKLIKEVSSLGGSTDCIKQHYYWTGKDCPSVIRADGNWNDLILEVNKGLKVVPEWVKEAIKYLENKGILDAKKGWIGNEDFTIGLVFRLMQRVLEYCDNTYTKK